MTSSQFRCKKCGAPIGFRDKEDFLKEQRRRLDQLLISKQPSKGFDQVAWTKLLIQSATEDLCFDCYAKALPAQSPQRQLWLQFNRLTKKEQERFYKEEIKDWVENSFIPLFTKGPDFHKLAESGFVYPPEIQEHCRQALYKVAEIIKEIIVAYEDFLNAKKGWVAHTEGVERARRKLKEALDRLNQVPSKHMSFSLQLGQNSDDLEKHSTSETLDPRAKEFYGDKILAYDAAMEIENFKTLLASLKEQFPLGVCRYEKCRKFFVKERKDERYCSKSHAKLDWQLEKREQNRFKSSR